MSEPLVWRRTEKASEEIVAAGRKDEDEILKLIDADPAATLAKLAQAMGWKLFSGEPNKMRAKRCVDALKRAKFIKETRAGRWQLTPEGDKVLKGETDDKNAVTVATAKMLQP